jgi:hypothetical protein
MAITAEQRTDIGARYVTEIQRRIEVRTAAKVQIRKLPGEKNPAVLAAAQADLNDLAGGSKLTVVSVEVNEYNGTASMKLLGGEYFSLDHIPAKLAKRTATLLTHSDEEKKAEKKNQELCRELEFLNGALAGTNIGAFQSYCARLWAPAKKTDFLPAADFKAHIEAFLNTKRGFTCAL